MEENEGLFEEYLTLICYVFLIFYSVQCTLPNFHLNINRANTIKVQK